MRTVKRESLARTVKRESLVRTVKRVTCKDSKERVTCEDSKERVTCEDSKERVTCEDSKERVTCEDSKERVTYKYCEQEAEQLQGGADVGEVWLVTFNSHQNLVEPGELQVGARPHLRSQRHLEERDATPRQQLPW